MNFKRDFKFILNNQRGVALMMVMTAIILLMAIYGEFTFESKISRLKATNILDKSQAKLLAESGQQLALARLRLYKEAYNKIQSNQDAKKMVQSQLLNQLWELPFIYPVPIMKDTPSSAKDTINKFTKETLLDGELKVTIQNLSNRLNLNMLRIDVTKFNPDKDEPQDSSSLLNMADNAILNNVSVEQSLFFLLKRLVDEKKEKDEDFNERYSNLNYQELVTNLKYYVSDFGTMMNDPFAAEAENRFRQIPLSPKFGPLASISELYSMPGWDDQLIELIQNEFSVYPNTQIDFNKLTSNMLRILLPTLSDTDISDFFLWRDDPERPKFLNTKADFKKYFVEQERLISDTYFEDRLKLFEQKGISFGANPNLFKIVSEGTYNRSTYTLVSYVVLPKQENKPNPNQCPPGQIGTPPNCRPRTAGDPPLNENDNPTPPTTPPTETPTQLLEPRIIEIQIN